MSENKESAILLKMNSGEILLGILNEEGVDPILKFPVTFGSNGEKVFMTKATHFSDFTKGMILKRDNVSWYTIPDQTTMKSYTDFVKEIVSKGLVKDSTKFNVHDLSYLGNETKH